MGNENSQQAPPENPGGPAIEWQGGIAWQDAGFSNLPAPREGHTAVAVGKSIYYFGGGRQGNGPSSPPLQFCDVWCQNTDTGECKQVSDGGDILARTGAAACAVGSKIYIFGGLSNDKGYLGDMVVFDTENDTWSRPTCSGMFPSGRDKATLCTAPGGKHVILYGGFGPGSADEMDEDEEEEEEGGQGPIANFVWHDDVRILDVETGYWSAATIIGDIKPTARAAHAASVVGDSLYVFGGRDTVARTNDMYMLDLAPLGAWIEQVAAAPGFLPPLNISWKAISPVGAYPKARSFHTMIALNNRLVMFGGLDRAGQALGDAHVYDLASNAWVQCGAVQADSQPIPPRAFHSMSLVSGASDFVVVFGGSTSPSPQPGQIPIYLPKIWQGSLEQLGAAIAVPQGYAMPVAAVEEGSGETPTS